MGQDVRTKDSIIAEQKSIIWLTEEKFTTQKSITGEYKASYDKLSKEYGKSEKRLRIFKNTTFILLSTTILLGSIIVLIK